MKFLTYYYEEKGDVVELYLSKNFKKEAIRQLSILLRKEIGEGIDFNTFYLKFKSLPININSTKTEVRSFSIIYLSDYSSYCTLFWENLKSEECISCESEVEKGSIRFWLENLDVKPIQRDLEKYAYLKKVVFLDGFRFVVEVKQPSINISFKLILEDKLFDFEVKSIENYLAKTIGIYNEHPENGVIHSCHFVNYKVHNMTFSIDLGSAVDKGLNYILQSLNESSFKIKKVEVKGI